MSSLKNHNSIHCCVKVLIGNQNHFVGTMKLELLFLVFGFLVAVSSSWSTEQEKKFSEWKANFKKKYATPEEEEKAKESMFENDGKIQEHNKRFKEGKETFQRGLWKRSDLSLNEKKKVLANARNIPSNSSNLLQSKRLQSKSALPVSLNWTAHGLVHAVEDQRTCGGCYAFASIGVIEGVMLRKGVTNRLSTQQIIDCDKKNLGCGGGDPLVALKYIKTEGVGDADLYPYLNKKGNCKIVNPISEVSGVKKIDLNSNEMKLMEVVAQYGPVVGKY